MALVDQLLAELRKVSSGQRSEAGAGVDVEQVGLRPSARPGRRPRSPRNSGAGRLGRLLNSGWAWVPTQNGWPGSSTNSTSRPSGESPEHEEPGVLELAAVACC